MKKKIAKFFSIVLAFAMCLSYSTVMAKPKIGTKLITVKIGHTKKLKLKNTKKKARWSIKDGKKYIKLRAKKKASVKIVGVKKGIAKVQCKIGKKKLICKVKVTAERAPKVNAMSASPTQKTEPRGTHIPTENRMMAEPLKKVEVSTETADGFPIWYPYGSDFHYFFGSTIKRSDIEQITFTDSNDVPQNAVSSMDLSERQNRSVMAWYVDSDNNGSYEVTIGQEGGVVANPNSSYLFSDIARGTAKKNPMIDGLEYFYTSDVTDMSNMFLRCGMSGTMAWTLDLGAYFDTSKVTNMSGMFAYFGAKNEGEVHLYLGRLFEGKQTQQCQIPFEGCNAVIHVSSSAVKEWIMDKQTSGWADPGKIVVEEKTW